MNGEFIIQMLSFALLALPLISVGASIFLWRVYLEDPARPRSWVLFHLAAGATVATVVAVAVPTIAILRMTNVFSGVASGIAQIFVVSLLVLIPSWYGVAVWRVRRGFNPPFPPFRDR